MSATPELSHRIERDPSGARTGGLRKGVGAGFIHFFIKAQSPCTCDQAKGSLNSGLGVHSTLELGAPGSPCTGVSDSEMPVTVNC